MPQYPTFTEGMRDRDQSATAMNRMSAAAARADNLNVGPGVQMRRSSKGNLLLADPARPTPILSTTRFVAVVIAPTKVDTKVWVRDVVYGVEDPEPVDLDREPEDEIHDFVKGDYTYRWGSSSRIEGIPGYGYEPMFFAGSVFADVDADGNEIAPTAGTPIFWLEMRGQGPPLLWPMNAKLTQQFKIATVDQGGGIYDNHLKVHTWDAANETEGTDIVEVARPWLLRVSPQPYSRNGITYVYVPDLLQERVATRGGDTETQVIVPRYRTGDIIYATTGIAGGLEGIWGPLPFGWLDDNRDSRAWAKKYEAPA